MIECIDDTNTASVETSRIANISRDQEVEKALDDTG